LTDLFEFHIISLVKLEKLAQDKEFEDSNRKELLNWLKFLINPEKEDIRMENSEDKEALKKAYEEWQKINQDPEERERARLREKYYEEMRGSKQYRNRRTASKSGEKNAKIEIAKSMKANNELIEKIIKYTGLTKEEIEKL